jgi:putative ABC transport system substrate-binding protein
LSLSTDGEGKYDRLPELAAELAHLKVDLIVTHGTPGTLAAKRTTATIPIVMAVSGDAVATGLVASVARPGGNITGPTFFFPELNAKRVELLKETAPRVTRVAVLINPDNPAIGPALKAMELAAKSLKVELQQVEVRGPDEFESAFSAMVKRRAQALAVVDDAMLIAQGRRVADLAAKTRFPSIGFREYAEAGGLMSYAVNVPEIWHRAAVFVDKILKGAKPDRQGARAHDSPVHLDPGGPRDPVAPARGTVSVLCQNHRALTGTIGHEA